MKILYMITRSDWGGAQAHLFDLLRKNCTSHECFLIVGEDGELAERTRELGVPVWIVPYLVQPIRPLYDLVAIHKVRNIIRQIQPDIIHLHSSKAGIVGRVAARITNVPSIFTAHGWAFTDGVSIVRKVITLPIEKIMGLYTEKIICVSDYDRQLALKYRISQPEKLITIHNGVPELNNVDLVRRPETQEKDKDSVLKCIMVARFSPQKDQATLLKAISQISNETPVELYLVGQGECIESMKNLANEILNNEKVYFLGPRTDIPELLADMDLFLLITNYEGFPLSILEAMRAGLPVIATDVGGVKEAVMDGVNGYLVARGDVDNIRDKIQLLAKNFELCKKMGNAGRVRFLEFFTSEKMLNQTVALYEEVIGTKKHL